MGHFLSALTELWEPNQRNATCRRRAFVCAARTMPLWRWYSTARFARGNCGLSLRAAAPELIILPRVMIFWIVESPNPLSVKNVPAYTADFLFLPQDHIHIRPMRQFAKSRTSTMRTLGESNSIARLASVRGNTDARTIEPPKLITANVNGIRIMINKNGPRLCCAGQSRVSLNS